MNVIYKITCTVNGKYYIGSTLNKTQRWARHRRELRRGKHVNKNMQASWTKYGEGSFVFEVLEVVEEPAHLFVAEQRYLDVCAGTPECFNWSRYAGAPMRGVFGPAHFAYGKKLPEEMKKRISAALSGEKHPNWGKKTPAETMAKIVEANKSNPWRGQKHTPEALAKIAAASKGRVVSEETRAKRSKALRGRAISTAQRLQISRTLSGEGNFWYGKKRPDHGAKVSKAIVATDPTGAQARYASILEARNALGLKAPTFNRALKSEKPLVRGPYRGWSFKYEKPLDLPTPG